MARMAARCTASLSDAPFGYLAAKCSCIAGIHFVYRANVSSIVRT